MLQLDFVLSSSAALDSAESSFILFSVAMSMLSISLTLNKIVTVLPEMEGYISKPLCLLYHCVEIMYRLLTFTAMFLVVGVNGVIFVLAVVLLRVWIFWLMNDENSLLLGCNDTNPLRQLMTRSLILTITDVLVHDKHDTPLFHGSTKIDAIKCWWLVRMAPHIEALIAFGTLFWHPWGQDVLRSRRLSLLYTALGAMVLKEVLHFDRARDNKAWDSSLTDEAHHQPLRKLNKAAK